MSGFQCGKYSTYLSTGCRCAECEAAYDAYIVSARGSALRKVGADFPAPGAWVWAAAVSA